jgi:hypothetical protein
MSIYLSISHLFSDTLFSTFYLSIFSSSIPPLPPSTLPSQGAATDWQNSQHVSTQSSHILNSSLSLICESVNRFMMMTNYIYLQF